MRRGNEMEIAEPRALSRCDVGACRKRASAAIKLDRAGVHSVINMCGDCFRRLRELLAGAEVGAKGGSEVGAIGVGASEVGTVGNGGAGNGATGVGGAEIGAGTVEVKTEAGTVEAESQAKKEEEGN